MGLDPVVLPELPLAPWRATKDTLHLWVQIAGKVRMACSPPRNHWWHVPLYVDVRGLTTRRLHARGHTFRIDFDLVAHRLLVATPEGSDGFALRDGLSVAEFDRKLHDTLDRAGVDVDIVESPFGVPMTTPFPRDEEHASYDAGAVERYRRILDWTDGVFDEFSGWYSGKTSPVHLYWHSLDLAFSRFSGDAAPASDGADPVTREAYSHEVIAFGFWAGDDDFPFPAYYSYTSPEPDDLRTHGLAPEGARWTVRNGGSLAVLPFDDMRRATDPRAALLAFLESSYQAGATAAAWRQDRFESSWCPAPTERARLLAR